MGALEDEELVSRAQKEDSGATEELVARYHQKAYRIAYHICLGEEEEAEDLTQEAFLKVFRNIKKFKGKSSFYTWFYRILVNTCVDGVRRRTRREKLFSAWRGTEDGVKPSRGTMGRQPETGQTPDPLRVLGRKQLGREALEALSSLSENQRTIFQLKAFHAMSIREISQIMGMAEGTVKSHLFRATRLLREALKEWASP